MLAQVLPHLEALVSYDTRNPPRAITTGGIFDYLRAQLPDFVVEVSDHGAGAVSLFAVRGQPKQVFNVHLDTVPSSPAWTADPLKLRVTDDRAIGLGACDIKGAAAALIAAAQSTHGDAAFLFTSDEEANDPRCIAAFLAREHGFAEAIIAEPTQGQAILAHRGISAVRMLFKGQAGHASAENALALSAVHNAMRWGTTALDYVQGQHHLRFGFRPLPSQNMDALHTQFREFAAVEALAEYEETFRGPSLPSGDVARAEERRLAARDLADELGLPIGNAVDFWTEASLFSAAGLTALVYGPGDIAQAHTADEWVSLEQLQRYAETVQRIFGQN